MSLCLYEREILKMYSKLVQNWFKKKSSFNLYYMKTKGEKVTYQWLSCNHRNFHCTRFPIFRWTEPCCSTYDEQTDRVELTTALGNLRCLIYTDPYYGARNQWLTNAGFPMTLLNWTSRCVKISKNTQQHSPKKKKYMRVPYTAVFEWGVVIFFLIIVWV